MKLSTIFYLLIIVFVSGYSSLAQVINDAGSIMPAELTQIVSGTTKNVGDFTNVSSGLTKASSQTHIILICDQLSESIIPIRENLNAAEKILINKITEYGASYGANQDSAFNKWYDAVMEAQSEMRDVEYTLAKLKRTEMFEHDSVSNAAKKISDAIDNVKVELTKMN
ncbi:MAG: hypothetical protein JNL63_08215 [Bacteroidia bacterium]|nr:hypothetical protein [Bacteroidia bacterium]